MSSPNLPKTDSIQELARFWDTHDVTDFEAELEEVGEPVFDRQTVVQVPLTCQDAEAVQDIAKQKGLAAAELIRQWVHEKVRTR